MSSGKKGKKKKGKTVGLMSFLAESGGTATVPVKSWADDVEEEHEGGGFSSRNSKEPVVLPTAPRAARGPRVADEDIPNNPPYIAYISNLPYEVDEEYLAEFFADMKISNMRLPKDSNKLRGYGYVEFEDRQSLIDALCLSNTPMKTRRIRIDVSNSTNDDRRGRMGRDNRRDNYDDPERTSGDWRSGPRDETSAPEGDSYRSRYDNRDRRDDREAADYDNKPGAWRTENSDRGRPTFRDRGGFRDDDRDKEWSRYDRENRDRDGDRDRGSSFGPRRNYGDSNWERDGIRRQERSSMDSKPEPRTRPKLLLQPRTKPVEATALKEESDDLDEEEAAQVAAPPSTPAPVSVPSSTPTANEPTPASAPVPSVNIFGAAKPVDTTAREREIEERLAKTYADSRSRDEGDADKRGTKDGAWGKRNGEGRDDKEREKERGRQTWRSEDEGSRRNERSTPRTQTSHSASDQFGESRGPPSSRGPAPLRGPPKLSDARGGSERDRKDRDRDDISRMPKAKDEQAPNFIASNKYSMLPDDVDPDNIDD